jgi:hypothetical protein
MLCYGCFWGRSAAATVGRMMIRLGFYYSETSLCGTIGIGGHFIALEGYVLAKETQ